MPVIYLLTNNTNLSNKRTTENRYGTNVSYLDHKYNWI